MPLETGTLLASYEITGLLGAGAMGEVYRAPDAKLNREVAIKVLPEEFAKDRDRLALSRVSMCDFNWKRPSSNDSVQRWCQEVRTHSLLQPNHFNGPCCIISLSKAPKGEWRTNVRAAYDENGKLAEYSINFSRQRRSGEWYDEIRYDSHEKQRGRNVLAPHFHLKILSGLKTDKDSAVEEVRSLIDNYLEKIEEVTGP